MLPDTFHGAQNGPGMNIGTRTQEERLQTDVDLEDLEDEDEGCTFT